MRSVRIVLIVLASFGTGLALGLMAGGCHMNEAVSLSRYDLAARANVSDMKGSLDALVHFRDLDNVRWFSLRSYEVISNDGAEVIVPIGVWVSTPKGGGRCIGFSIDASKVPAEVQAVKCRFEFYMGNGNTDCTLFASFARRPPAEYKRAPSSEWDYLKEDLQLEMTPSRSD